MLQGSILTTVNLQLKKQLAAAGRGMKLVSGICEELTVLNFGRILAQGETTKVLNDPEVIKAYLGE